MDPDQLPSTEAADLDLHCSLTLFMKDRVEIREKDAMCAYYVEYGNSFYLSLCIFCF